MPAIKKKFSRKDLKKPDEFVSKGTEYSELLTIHKKKILIGLGAVAGTLVIASAVYIFLEERTLSSSKHINEALEVLGRPVKTASLFSGTSEGEDEESFASVNEKDRAVGEAFSSASGKASTRSIRMLAKLGEAQSQLSLGEYEKAAASYQAFVDNPGGAEPFLYLAYEGLGMALEGQGKKDEALTQYKLLEGVGDGKYMELALYHQARIHEAKGEKDKAKELYSRLAKDISDAPKMNPMMGYLQERIAGKDGVPKTTPATQGYGEPGMLMGPNGQFMPTPGAGGGLEGLDEEQLQKLQELLEQMKQAEPPLDEQGDLPAPPPPAPGGSTTGGE